MEYRIKENREADQPSKNIHPMGEDTQNNFETALKDNLNASAEANISESTANIEDDNSLNPTNIHSGEGEISAKVQKEVSNFKALSRKHHSQMIKLHSLIISV